jgi:hypothetical protein
MEWSSSTVTDILEPIIYIRYVHSLTWLKKRSNVSDPRGNYVCKLVNAMLKLVLEVAKISKFSPYS